MTARFWIFKGAVEIHVIALPGRGVFRAHQWHLSQLEAVHMEWAALGERLFQVRVVSELFARLSQQDVTSGRVASAPLVVTVTNVDATEATFVIG